tara:strand:+ start:4855 stop:5073 length:219 start_codon:yes stop_codon:yes gene_type:complete
MTDLHLDSATKAELKRRVRNQHRTIMDLCDTKVNPPVMLSQRASDIRQKVVADMTKKFKHIIGRLYWKQGND